ncbi:MAG: 2-oxopent-4-enoate hydratase [Rubrobacteraceae bacterium]|nr:2-oxopent-4-enoate hydratase [Rubrobacteraceae bacterium]
MMEERVKMQTADIDTVRLARGLFEAFESGKAIPPLTGSHPELGAEGAYQIQQELVRLHEEAGRKIVARKVGLTSKAIQQQMGVDQPDYGVIFDEFVFENGTALKIGSKHMVQPRLEAELAFILETELRGPNVTVAQVLANTRGVLPVFEVIDSRIEDWRIKLADTIADNASGWGLVMGEVLTSPSGIDLETVGLVIERDGEVMATGAGAAALEHPARAVAWLANTLAGYGESLPPGEPILSGSLTAAVDAVPGRYRARFGEGLGSVELVMTA